MKGTILLIEAPSARCALAREEGRALATSWKVDPPPPPAGLHNKHCVVFGAGGFIGTNLCRRLRDRVGSLRAFGRSKVRPDALDGVEWLSGDFDDSAEVATALAGAQVVLHLVHSTTPSSANLDVAADIRSNVISTLGLLEACRSAKVERIVFVSSGGTIYGVPTQLPTPEDAACWPITAYGISKLAIERYLHLYEHLHGISYRVLRLSNPFGPYQVPLKSQGVIAAFVKNVLAGEPLQVWGDGSVRRDYIYVDDAVDALESSIVTQSEERVFNIGRGVSHSLLQIISEIEAATGIRAQVEFKSPRLVDVPTSELAIGRARDQLGWAPKVTLSDGIERTVAWVRSRQGNRLPADR